MVLYVDDGGVPEGMRTAREENCRLRSKSMLVVLVKIYLPAVSVMPNAKSRKKADSATMAMTQPSTVVSWLLS